MKSKVIKVIVVGLILAGLESLAHAQVVENKVHNVEKEWDFEIQCWAWSNHEKYKVNLQWKGKQENPNGYTDSATLNYKIENLKTKKTSTELFGPQAGFSYGHASAAGSFSDNQIKFSGTRVKHYRISHYTAADIVLSISNGMIEIESFSSLYEIGDYSHFPTRFSKMIFQTSYCQKQ